MANNMEKLGVLNEEQRKKMFSDDTTVLAKKVTTFVENFYPSYANAGITEDSLEKSWDFRNYSPQKTYKKSTLPTVYRNSNVIEF